MAVRVVDDGGRTCDPDEGGLLVIDRAGTGMARMVWATTSAKGAATS